MKKIKTEPKVKKEPKVKTEPKVKKEHQQDGSRPNGGSKKNRASDSEKILPLLTYDLLRIPTYITGETTKDVEKDNDIDSFRIRKGNRGTADLFRKNPAPHSRSFTPHWRDPDTGVEYALVQDRKIVEDKRAEDVNSIAFWVRVRGKDAMGVDKAWPLDNSKTRLVDIDTGDVAGHGYVREVYFTRKRVMGMVVLNPLRWDPESPLYFEEKYDSESE